MFREAALPAGFPPAGPVGEVRIKEYPAARVALVRSGEMNNASQNGMFSPLFKHIKKNDIAMTSPVVMDLSQADDASPLSMAFVYREPSIGKPGEDGKVHVIDTPPLTVISVAQRGGYNADNYAGGVEQLRKWLKANRDYETAGAPRVLAYNSPFIPGFLKLSEVQIPVRRVAHTPPQAPG